MLYREIIAVCSQIHTKHINTLSVLHFYSFTLATDTAVQNNNNEMSLHFNPMRLIFMNYSV